MASACWQGQQAHIIAGRYGRTRVPVTGFGETNMRVVCIKITKSPCGCKFVSPARFLRHSSRRRDENRTRRQAPPSLVDPAWLPSTLNVACSFCSFSALFSPPLLFSSFCTGDHSLIVHDVSVFLLPRSFGSVICPSCDSSSYNTI